MSQIKPMRTHQLVLAGFCVALDAAIRVLAALRRLAGVR